MADVVLTSQSNPSGRLYVKRQVDATTQVTNVNVALAEIM